MRIKLNRWQWIGIATSVIWAVIGGLWGSNLGLQRGGWVVGQLVSCYKEHSLNWMQWCYSDFERVYSGTIKYRWSYSAIVAFAPILVAWLVAYRFGLWRWIRPGNCRG